MNQTVLITGGTGYIGSHTAVEFLQKGYQVIIVDNLSNSQKNVLDGIEAITGKMPLFYQVDCTDKEAMLQLFRQHTIDGVIHFAASKAVGESVQKPLLYYRNNLLSLIVLLECMQECAVDHLVFSSSCTVYGQPKQLPVSEEAPILPATSPYGNTKQINEEIIRDTAHADQATLKAIILRYFNPIGAHPSSIIGEEPRGVPQNLVPFLTQTVAGIRKELAVFGNDYSTPDGSCIRDYIYIVDLAKAHLAAFERLFQKKTRPASVEVFNVGTGKGASVLELIAAFEKATGEKVPYRVADRREGDIEAIWADPKKANEELGWKADTSLEDTLLTAWNWQKKLQR